MYIWSAKADRVMQGGRLRMAQESDQSGVSVRLLKGGRQASSSVAGLDEEDLDWAIEKGLGAAAYVPRSSYFDRFAEPQGDPGPPSTVDPRVADPEVGRLMDAIDPLAQRVLDAEGIDYFEAVTGAYRGTFAVANSQGIGIWDRNAYERTSLELRFEDLGQHRYTVTQAYARQPLSYERDLAGRTEEAISLVRSTKERGKLGSPASTVILDPMAASGLLNRVSNAVRGQEAARGRTNFAGQLGEQVASPELTLVDRPRSEEGVRVQRADDEGIATRTTPIIQDGVLETYLYDWNAALETGAAPTGHGLRPRSKRYEGGPAARPCNLEIEPGTWSLEEMIEEVDRGVIVRGPFLGSFTASPVTGDFSLVAPLAFLIQDGQLRHAVPSTTVTGNLFEALGSIQGVGEETRRLVNGLSAPLLIEGVTCVA